MSKNTIVMWGQGRKSADTQRKLQVYDRYRKDPHKRHKIYTDTIIFEQPLDGVEMQTVHPLESSTREWTGDSKLGSENLSAKIKRQHYRDIYTNSLDTLFDYEPYVDLAILPISDRPYTLQQCIDFFYPMSGVSKHIKTQSPFTSTWPNSYDNSFKRKKYATAMLKSMGGAADLELLESSTMPVDLGEVSMFYFWNCMYRLLLCPKAFRDTLLPSPENLFSESPDQRKVFVGLISDTNTRVSNALQNLSKVRSTVNAVGRVALAAAQGDTFNAESILEAAKTEIRNIVKKGITNIARELAADVGISKASSNSIVNYLREGKFNTERLVEISRDDSTLATIDTIVRRNLNSLADEENILWSRLPESDQDTLRDLSTFGSDYSKIPTSKFRLNRVLADRLSALKAGGASKLTPEGARMASILVQSQHKASISAKEAFSKLKAARSNGFLAVALIGGAKMAFDAYLDSEEKELNKLEDSVRRFATTRVIRLDPRIADDTAEFVIDSQFSLVGGAKDDGDWHIKPYCGVVLGKPFKKYMIQVYSILRPIINRMRTGVYNGNPNKFRKDLFSSTARIPEHTTWTPNVAYCHPFDLFQKQNVPLISTARVLEYLKDYSPFTQAFGFEPTFLSRDTSDTNGKRELNTKNGLSDRTSYELGIFGSALNKGKTFADYRNGIWTAPGNTRNYVYVTSYDADRRSAKNSWTWWSTDKLQGLRDGKRYSGKKKNGAHNKTVNSQRKLNSATPYGYAGFTDLTFDVATGVPIFNAQWSAMVSVILCNKEALNTISSLGYRWANPLVQERDRNFADAEDTFKTVKSIMGLRQQGKMPFMNFQLSPKGFNPQLFTQMPFFPILSDEGKTPSKDKIPSKDKTPKSEVAADTEKTSTPFIFKPRTGKTEKKQDATQLAVQLGVTTASLGLLAILALKLRRLK